LSIFFESPVFAEPQAVRVQILRNAESASLKINGIFEIKDGGTVLLHGRSLNSTVKSFRGGLLISGRNFKAEKVFVDVEDNGTIVLNGRHFKGNIEFIRDDSGSFSVVNYINLEDYIKGILYHETSHYWPMEVLKAQAIACRTYALYQMQENKTKDFDVTNDIYSQVYGGSTSERERTSRAVDYSRGLILTFEGKVFPAYFHATCAGRTEDASLIWNIDIAPLKGASCGFCQDSPHFNWHYVLSAEEMQDILNIRGDIKSVTALGRDVSGRVTDVEIISDKKTVKIAAKDLRYKLGPNSIRSTNFTVKMEGKDIIFEGIGWGHGAGMCQWGAYFMAKDGLTADQILKNYYPGAQISSVNQ